MSPIGGGAADMVTALARGTADIARTAAPYLLQDLQESSENVAIAAATASPIHRLIAKLEIKFFARLKGKAIRLP